MLYYKHKLLGLGEIIKSMYRDIDSLNSYHTSVEAIARSDFEALKDQTWPPQWHPSEDFPTPQSVSTDEFDQAVNDAFLFSDDNRTYKLGESYLPVAQYREYFLDTIEKYQCTVVSSETGSGKTSQLGLYLLEAGYPRVFVSSPRILAARESKERAQHNLGPDYAHLAGYLTGNADDSDCHPDARLIYITEDLLFKMARRGGLRPNDVVINDEAHERTPGTIFLMDRVRDLQQKYPDLKLIVSSASIDTGKFSRHLPDKNGKPAPVMILPGRTFPVEWSETDESVAAVAKKHMRHGHNVLAFEPGMARMKETWAKMSSRMRDQHTVHMLHGDLSPREQKAALDPADGNHIVANKVGETSITPQGKDVVVDSGLSNVGRYEQGVRVLQTIFSSQDEIIQRAGRVGRTAPGKHILATPADTPPPPSFEDRDGYGLPPIETSSVATYMAELLASGIKIEELSLLESPTAENLSHDYKVLARIGATAVENGEVVLTRIGHQLIDLPIDVTWARMVVEARNLPPQEEADVRAVHIQAAAAVAVQQVKGILSTDGKRRYLLSRRNQEILSHENSSDLLFGLDVFVSAYDKYQEMATSDDEGYEEKFEMYLRSKDILVNRFIKARRTFEEVCRREGLDPLAVRKPTNEERELLVACQISGAEELFVKRGKFVYNDIRGDTQRRLGKQSTITHGAADLIVGMAFNRRGLRATGEFEKRFVTGGSVVTPEQVMRHASHRVTSRRIGYGVTNRGTIAEKRSLYFDGNLPFGELHAELSPTIETREFIIRAMMTGLAPRIDKPHEKVPFSPFTPNSTRAIRTIQRAQEIEDRSIANLRVRERLEKIIQKAVKDSVELLPLDVTDIASVDAVLPPVYVNNFVRPSRRKKIGTILATSPEGVDIELEEGETTNLPVFYKDNVAYVTVPGDARLALKREDFAGLEQYHYVKLRFGNSKYQRIDAAFESIQRQREKRQKKLDRRAEAAAAVASAVIHGTDDETSTKSGKRIRNPKPKMPKLVALPVKGNRQHYRFPTKHPARNRDVKELAV